MHTKLLTKYFFYTQTAKIMVKLYLLECNALERAKNYQKKVLNRRQDRSDTYLKIFQN